MNITKMTICALCAAFGMGAFSVVAHAEETLDENMTYAIISESNTTPLLINSQNTCIDGLVYSNFDIESSIEIENQRNNFDTDYNVTNFSSEFMTFDKPLENHDDDFEYSGYENTVNTYGMSNIAASDYALYVDEMFGANENVSISSGVVSNVPEKDDSIIFSSNGNITINTGTFDFDGIVYAPNGSVTINANTVDMYGLIVAEEVIINSENVHIVSNPVFFDEYEIEFYTLNEAPADLDLMAAAGSGASSWYYNTGTSVKTQAVYSKYRLLSTVKTGDIIHENRSWSPSIICGHIACVEGVYYLPAGSYTTYKHNIRLIEAISCGVCRSVLDDTRCDDNRVKLLRYKYSIPTYKMNSIISFLIGQLGKPYSCDGSRDTSFNASKWYCSELVWAAYNYVGYDIEDGNFGFITPGDILDSGNTQTISYK